MLRIAAAQLLSHFWIRAIPEAAQIAGDLHRPAVRREQRRARPLRADARPAASRRGRTVPAISPTPRRCRPRGIRARARPLGTSSDSGASRVERAHHVGRKRALELHVVQRARAVRRRADQVCEVDLADRQTADAAAACIVSSGTALEPRVGQQLRGDLGIDRDVTLGEHQRVVAIDRSPPAPCRSCRSDERCPRPSALSHSRSTGSRSGPARAGLVADIVDAR